MILVGKITSLLNIGQINYNSFFCLNTTLEDVRLTQYFVVTFKGKESEK